MDTDNGLYNIYELILNWFEHFDEICASNPLNYSFQKGELSITLIQSIITCLSKGNKLR